MSYTPRQRVERVGKLRSEGWTNQRILDEAKLGHENVKDVQDDARRFLNNDFSGLPDNVRFNAEILGTEGLSPHVQVMLIRECINFVTTFAGEWLKNIEMIEQNGFTIGEHDGQLVCTKRHFRDDSALLGRFTDFENLMAVGQAIMSHNLNATHMDEEPRTVPRPTFRNGSTCGPDCPTHAHNHYRKIVGD